MSEYLKPPPFALRLDHSVLHDSVDLALHQSWTSSRPSFPSLVDVAAPFFFMISICCIGGVEDAEDALVDNDGVDLDMFHNSVAASSFCPPGLLYIFVGLLFITED